ncbi:MAG: hypothetical protein ACI9EK_000722 [Psychroserpens sp.]|jgi:hypothetical protein
MINENRLLVSLKEDLTNVVASTCTGSRTGHFLNDFYNLLQCVSDISIDWAAIMLGISFMMVKLVSNEAAKTFWLFILFISIVIGPIFTYILFENEGHSLSIYLLSVGALIIKSLIAGVVTFLGYRFYKLFIERVNAVLLLSAIGIRESRSDIRDLLKNVIAIKEYNPIKYFKKGFITFGLNEYNKAVRIPIDLWNSSHKVITGITGFGKSVLLGVLSYQAGLHGHAIIALDPKSDKYLPYVLALIAKVVGRPFYSLDLKGNTPQLSLFHNKTELEMNALFESGSNSTSKGGDSDIYKALDRAAQKLFSKFIFEKNENIRDLFNKFKNEYPDEIKAALKFQIDMDELIELNVLQAKEGLDIPRAIKEGAIIYIKGDTRNETVIRLQRLLLLSVFQFCESREIDNSRPVSLIIDEYKYASGKLTRDSLGMIRSFNTNLTIAFQSYSDLLNCGEEISSESIIGSVEENCAIKVSYRVNSYDMATKLASGTGTIPIDEEVRKFQTDNGLNEEFSGERSFRQSERYFVDQNTYMSLPAKCGVMTGYGLAKLIKTAPIKVKRDPQYIKPTIFENEAIDNFRDKSVRDLIDVD